MTTPTSIPKSLAPTQRLNLDDSPLTYRTATHGPDSEDWYIAETAEIDRLLVTTTMHAIHLHQQPSDRRGDTNYYNPKPKEKYDDDMNKVFRIRGTAGGDHINYDGPTKANTAALSTVKILLQSVVSDLANFMTFDIKYFYSWRRCRAPSTSASPRNFYPLRSVPSTAFIPFFSTIQFYSKSLRACMDYRTRGNRPRQPYRASGYP